MAGIYIHIPFCKKACHYCNFHFSTSLKYRSEMVDTIKTELTQRAKAWSEELIDTIYFGGGTPSLLSYQEINSIIETIHDNFHLSESPEITIECNPDDLQRENLKHFIRSGINRFK